MRTSIQQGDSGPQVIQASNDAYVDDWIARVISAGGAQPSQPTIDALNTFCGSLRSDGLDGLMVSMNPVVPDNVIASITPLIKTDGYDSWINTGGISDLTVDGLANPTDGYLETGVIPSDVFGSSCGITMYISDELPSDGTFECGASNASGTEQLVFYPNLGGDAYFDAYDTTTGRITAATPIASGYFTASRTSDVFFYIAVANSLQPHTTIVSDITSGSVAPPIDFWFYTRDTDGSPSSVSRRRYSFLALHFGLTEVQSQLFFDAIQTLRTNLGGGDI